MFFLYVSVNTINGNRVHYSGLENRNVSLLRSISSIHLENLPRHLVISAPPEIREEIPLILNRKLLFSTPGINFFPMRNYEAIERKVLDDYLQGDISEFRQEDLQEMFNRHFENWNQKSRIERRFSIFKVGNRDADLRLLYEEYLRYAKDYQNKLNEVSFLIEELDRYGVGAILRITRSTESSIQGFICKAVPNDFLSLTLCTKSVTPS
jgi:hypothetical protein